VLDRVNCRPTFARGRGIPESRPGPRRPGSECRRIRSTGPAIPEEVLGERQELLRTPRRRRSRANPAADRRGQLNKWFARGLASTTIRSATMSRRVRDLITDEDPRDRRNIRGRGSNRYAPGRSFEPTPGDDPARGSARVYRSATSGSLLSCPVRRVSEVARYGVISSQLCCVGWGGTPLD